MKKLLNECIIVAKRVGDTLIMAKNRDRAYKPQLEVVHEIIDGVEVGAGGGGRAFRATPRLPDGLAAGCGGS